MSSRIVVGVDGSESSERALRWAARQARLTGGELHAVQVWEVPHAGPYVPEPALGRDWEDEARIQLTHTVKRVLGDTPGVRLDVVRGHPTEALLELAGGAELLVVGSRGRGGFAGLLLGSVSQYLVTHVGGPVVVVH